jgi:tetratricopeptide (TPR) repeat protein
VDKSLLRREPEDRYQIHELLRQYAWDQLKADPEATKTTYTLHCMYYADFLYRCSASITGPRQQEVLRSITTELRNIRAAWQQAVDDTNLPALEKAAYTYYQYCDFTGRYLEGAEAFELAVARLVKNDEAYPQATEVLALLQSLLGYHYIRLGKYESAKKAFLAGQEILKAHQLEIRPGFSTDPVTGLSLLALVNGDYPTSIQYAEAGREASLLRNDPLNLQIACYVLANANFAIGENKLALAHVREGLLSTESTGNRWMKAQLLNVQGQIAQAQNQYALAQQKYQESYRIKRELNDPEGEATALNHMAMIALLQDNAEEANQLYLRSLDLYLRINDPGGLGSTYAGLGDSALAKGDFSAACHYYRQGLQLAIQIQWLPLTISLLTGISNLLLHAGRAKESAILLNQVLVHPAITEDTRVRARQSLDRILPHLPSQDDTATFTKQTDEDLFHISRALLAELVNLEGQVSLNTPTGRVKSHPSAMS